MMMEMIETILKHATALPQKIIFIVGNHVKQNTLSSVFFGIATFYFFGFWIAVMAVPITALSLQALNWSVEKTHDVLEFLRNRNSPRLKAFLKALEHSLDIVSKCIARVALFVVFLLLAPAVIFIRQFWSSLLYLLNWLISKNDSSPLDQNQKKSFFLMFTIQAFTFMLMNYHIPTPIFDIPVLFYLFCFFALAHDIYTQNSESYKPFLPIQVDDNLTVNGLLETSIKNLSTAITALEHASLKFIPLGPNTQSLSQDQGETHTELPSERQVMSLLSSLFNQNSQPPTPVQQEDSSREDAGSKTQPGCS